MNDIRVSPFGDVDAFKTYHGAYVQDSWRATSKLTVNYGLRWDWFSREQEREAEQANMVPGPPARYLIPAEWRDKPLSPSFVSNLREGRHRAGLHRRVRQRPRQDAEEQLRAARSMPRTSSPTKHVLPRRLRPVLRRVREPRRQPEPRLQLSVPVHADLPVAERRRAEPAAGRIARRPRRPRADRRSTRSTSTPTA